MASVMNINNGPLPVATAINEIVNYKKHHYMQNSIDLQPSYQRSFIWNSDFKDKLLYSLIRKYPIGNICLRELDNQNSRGAMREVVDGQQRLTTIYNFVKGDGPEGKYIIQGKTAIQIANYIVEYMGDDPVGDDPSSKLAIIKEKLNGRAKISLGYDDLPDEIQGNINAYPLSISIITNASDEQIAEYFRFLQNQERLRAGEILNSIPQSALEKYYLKVTDSGKLMAKVGFKDDDRREFDHIFYGVVGLLDNRIALGVANKDIIEYVSNPEPLSPEGKSCVNRLIQQLNSLADNDAIPHKFVGFKTIRIMRFFFLLLGFGYVSIDDRTQEKLRALDEIDNCLTAFSSAKKDQVPKIFEGYSSEVIEEYRAVQQVSVRRQPYKRVKNRMSVLAYYVNNFSNKTVPSNLLRDD